MMARLRINAFPSIFLLREGRTYMYEGARNVASVRPGAEGAGEGMGGGGGRGRRGGWADGWPKGWVAARAGYVGGEGAARSEEVQRPNGCKGARDGGSYGLGTVGGGFGVWYGGHGVSGASGKQAAQLPVCLPLTPLAVVSNPYQPSCAPRLSAFVSYRQSCHHSCRQSCLQTLPRPPPPSLSRLHHGCSSGPSLPPATRPPSRCPSTARPTA